EKNLSRRSTGVGSSRGRLKSLKRGGTEEAEVAQVSFCCMSILRVLLMPRENFSFAITAPRPETSEEKRARGVSIRLFLSSLPSASSVPPRFKGVRWDVVPSYARINPLPFHGRKERIVAGSQVLPVRESHAYAQDTQLGLPARVPQPLR